jgi:hypothetical protein
MRKPHGDSFENGRARLARETRRTDNQPSRGTFARMTTHHPGATADRMIEGTNHARHDQPR